MELIIKNKLDKRSRSSVVINLEMETRAEIDRLALASGHSFNEIVEMLIEFALPHSRLADEKPVEAVVEEEVVVEPEPEPAPAPVTRAATKGKTVVVTTPKTVAVPKVTPSKSLGATKTIASKTTTVKAEPIDTKTKPVHSQVPTFKLPPIAPTKSKTTKPITKK